MLTLLKAQCYGIHCGLKYGLKTIKEESRWYIIPFILDIVLLPVKLVIVNVMCLTKCGRQIILPMGLEILAEVED